MSLDLNVYIQEPARFSGFLPFIFTSGLMGDGVLYRDGFES